MKSNVRVPKMVGGRIHMILGLIYQSIYPVPIHTMANGLTLFESKLRPSEPGLLACIGGPVKHLESLCTAAGEDATFSYISCLVNNMNDYKFTVDFFPGEKRLIHNKQKSITVDPFDHYSEVDSEEEDDDDLMESHAQCDHCNNPESFHSVQRELDKYFEKQNTGLGTDYRCPSCRNCRQCLQGPGREKLSIKQEREQEIIKKSVKIDEDTGRAVASLAFMMDPNEYIKPNKFIAMKRLESVFKQNPSKEVREMLSKAFKKLIDRGHIVPWDKLSEDQRKRISESKSSYYLPWNTSFKEGSFNTNKPLIQ